MSEKRPKKRIWIAPLLLAALAFAVIGYLSMFSGGELSSINSHLEAAGTSVDDSVGAAPSMGSDWGGPNRE